MGTFPNSTTTPPTYATRAGGIVAIIGGATPTAYASKDTFAQPGANLQSFDGTTGLNLPNATLTLSANGLSAAPDGSLQYLTNNGGTQQIYKFTNTNSASVLVGTVTAPIGDTIFNTLTAGDNAFDSNGRHYYFASVDGFGNTGYLYYIDPSFQAHLLGSVPTPGGATGLAFDGAGNLYTSSRGRLDKIVMNNGFTITEITGTPTHTIVDLGSCAAPVINPLFSFADGLTKKVINTTTDNLVTTLNTGKLNDILEYQITIKNSGNIPSDNTKFIDTIPVGSSYIAGSTKICDYLGNNCTTAADLSSTAAPFTATGGMLVNSPAAPAGVVNAGTPSAAMVKFQVKITGGVSAVNNTSTITYPVVNNGIFSTGAQTSLQVKTVLSVAVSGKVWNDIDGSGRGGFNLITTPPGEVGTNANNAGLFAVLVDGSTPSPKVIGSQAIAANGTYSFDVLPNQTGVTIQLSTGAGTANSTTIPPQAIPAGWKNTAPKVTPAFNVALTDITDKDFGIAQPAGLVLVKRITGIKPVGSTTWNRTANPYDSTIALNTVVPNPTGDPAGNATNPNWPSNYVIGAHTAGKVKPGDEIEYTIYYLNKKGADTKNLKICDPIRGRQTYTAGSMQMLPGGASTPITLTDAVGLTVDRANSFAAGAVPAGCTTGIATSLSRAC